MLLKVGFIGLGLMGNPMCRHVQRKYPATLNIWNRTYDKCLPFMKTGVIPALSPKNVAEQSDIVILCVTDEIAVNRILFEDDGLLSASKKIIIVDHSTISPVAAEKIAENVRQLGALYIDAPVTGSVPGAVNGSLVVFAGGNLDALESARPVLNTYSSAINYMGNNGAGQATKICNQIMLHNTILSTFETINLAKAQGLELTDLFSALKGTLIDSRAWQIFGEAVFNKTSKLAHIKDMAKDMSYVKAIANRTKSSLFLTQSTINILENAMSKGMGQEDVTSLIKLYEAL